MRLALRLPALLAAWLLLCAGQALAASPLLHIEVLKRQVSPGTPTTYADLLKLIFPEPAPGQKEQPQTPPARQINGYFKIDGKNSKRVARPSQRRLLTVAAKAQIAALRLIASGAGA